MKEKVIYITDTDKKRLKQLIREARAYGSEHEIYLEKLEGELNRGKVVKSKEIPKDVITMNSKVRLKDLATREEMIYSLVFPDSADPDQNKISILAPIGTALLGYKVGDVIEWKVPAGLRKLKVLEVLYQPESAGDYHL
ncbi:MAG: nucleoside diphosphate kinase regulator [Elusimicrobiota bacterium]|nr:nucleoside diphosphate kinase regulator [Elusimicrobiota bacterium]